MSKNEITFLKAVAAGILIGIGGTIYLVCDNKYIGSILFSLGLFSIILFKLNLFTGKVGYLFNNKPKYLLDLLIIWIGNLIGSFIIAFMIKNTRIYNLIYEKVSILSETKLNDNLISIFLLSICCGLLMYVAVEGSNKTSSPLIIILPITVFILCGFEHCIANMYYFLLDDKIIFDKILYILIMTLGNTVGSLILPICNNFNKES